MLNKCGGEVIIVDGGRGGVILRQEKSWLYVVDTFPSEEVEIPVLSR